MGMLKITDCTEQHFTCVDHAFIDSYMAKANGEYVKVYLLLLRRMESSSPFSVSVFAEILDNTEGDIIRALKYCRIWGLGKRIHIFRGQSARLRYGMSG